MTTAFRPRTLVLFVGDLLSFVLALWLSLFLRAFELPGQTLFVAHLAPFSLLFVAWVAVFFIAGLYETRLLVLARQALSTTLLAAQTFNLVIAALFFFFVPLFGIAPKTLLFIYLIVSFFVVLYWRAVLFPRFGMQKAEPVAVLGSGPELEEIKDALAAAHRPPVRIVEPASGVAVIDLASLYEDMFGRVPLSAVNEEWLEQNISRNMHRLYDPVKRLMDIVIALPALALSLLLYPLIIAALKIQDGGEALIGLDRVGLKNQTFSLIKFRSMSGNDNAEYGKTGASRLTVTPVGKVLRVSRLDEIPQFWNVIKGDISLIGPRPEAPKLVDLYQKEIPHYNVRHLVRPGLSGWAQLYHDNHPHAVTDVEATREKLSYDLYYLKHRSLVLDATIALKTISKLLTRSGV